MTFTQITITQDFNAADGAEPTGTVTFTPTTPMLNSGRRGSGCASDCAFSTTPNTGQELTIAWVQDATGGRTYVWPTDCRFAGNSAPSDTTLNTRTSVRFVRESGVWCEIARAVAVPKS